MFSRLAKRVKVQLDKQQEKKKQTLRQISKTDITNASPCSGCHSELGLALYFTETLYVKMKRWLMQDRLKSSICWDRDSFQPIRVHYSAKW